MSESLIKVEGVSKKYCRSLKRSLWYGMQDLMRELTGRSHGCNEDLRPGEFWSVNDVSFELRRGECLGLIGPNGAGKSTLLKMLNGLIKPNKGRITIRGRVGALIELGAGFNPVLTGIENIFVNGTVLGYTKNEIKQKLAAIIDFSELNEFINSPVQNYSSGMKVKLGFAIASELNVDLLLLDEVLAVGDMSFRFKCLSKVNEMVKDSAVILVSHDMKAISRYCNKAVHLSEGKIVEFGEPQHVIDNYISTQIKHKKLIIGNTKIISDFKINGNESDSVDINEKSNIRLSLEVKKDINIRQDYMVRIVIKDLSDEAVTLSEHVISNIYSDEHKSNYYITCDIPAFSLFPGHYWIDVGIHSPSLRQTYELISNCRILKISGVCSRYGGYKSRLLAKWSIVD